MPALSALRKGLGVTIPCQFRLHRRTLDQLDALADRLSLNRTDVIRLAIVRLYDAEPSEMRRSPRPGRTPAHR